MLAINEQIARDLDRLAQLKRQKGKQDQFEKSLVLDVDTRRQIIIGGMVADVFPEVSRFQPLSTEADNEVEFARFGAFLALLAGDIEYVERLKERVSAAFN